MDNTNKTDHRLSGVGCEVYACKYHKDNNYCSAPHIDVRKDNATTGTETFCSTFDQKTF